MVDKSKKMAKAMILDNTQIGDYLYIDVNTSKYFISPKKVKDPTMLLVGRCCQIADKTENHLPRFCAIKPMESAPMVDKTKYQTFVNYDRYELKANGEDGWQAT